ncbi:MAG: hypothetical protein ACI9XC_002604 [Gammaproteobacteria bacterium]|jgi:hypothetical protein
MTEPKKIIFLSTKTLGIAAFIGFIVMLAYIIYAVMNGSLSKEGPALIAMPWGLVSIVDLYLGLILFSFWVVWRESFRVRGIFWALMVLGFGNVISCLYILMACLDTKGNLNKFWLGTQYDKTYDN